jgi:hypothetical protein
VTGRGQHAQPSQGVAKHTPDVEGIYSVLCDATHPNIESQGTLCRSGDHTVQHRRAIAFAPGGSDSPVKVSIVEALGFSISMLLPFTRDLWWIGAPAYSQPANAVVPKESVVRPR